MYYNDSTATIQHCVYDDMFSHFDTTSASDRWTQWYITYSKTQ